MITPHKILVAAGIVAAVSSSVLAQESYPRLVGDAESHNVEYAPAFRGNTVGGGPVTISVVEEGRLETSYNHANFAQTRTDGLVPVMLGGEDDHTVTWISSGPAPQLARTGSAGPAGAIAEATQVAAVPPGAAVQPARRVSQVRGKAHRNPRHA